MSNIFLQIMDENGKKTAIRREIIMTVREKDDGTTQIGVAWPWSGMEYFTFEGLTYEDFVNKLCSLEEED